MPKTDHTTANIRNYFKIELQRVVRDITDAMQVYHSELITKTYDVKYGAVQLEQALYDFYLARSMDTAPFRAGQKPSQTLCQDYSRLMALFASSDRIFSRAQPEIAALTAAILLQQEGFTSNLTKEAWVQVIVEASKSRKLAFRLSELERLRIQFARAIVKHWH